MHHRESGMQVGDLVSPGGFLWPLRGYDSTLGRELRPRRPEGSPAQVTRALFSSFLALSRCWAGGRRRSGSPGWRRSCRACSGCGRRSGTCSSRTVRRGENVSAPEARAPAQRGAHLDTARLPSPRLHSTAVFEGQAARSEFSTYYTHARGITHGVGVSTTSHSKT